VPEVLAVGDEFIPAGDFRSAMDDLPADVTVRTFQLPGTKAEQHESQQLMEKGGAHAVPAPPELRSAIGAADVLCVHFAPVSAEVLAAGEALKLVAVARTGLENVDIPAATDRGIGVVPVFGRNASAVAELQIGLMLAEYRRRRDYVIGRLRAVSPVPRKCRPGSLASCGKTADRQ